MTEQVVEPHRKECGKTILCWKCPHPFDAVCRKLILKDEIKRAIERHRETLEELAKIDRANH